MSADLDEHLEYLQHYVDLGFDEVYVHNVGPNQGEFVRAYGKHVIPNLRWPARG
jgi:coenzyme F420-dependent glucose-6-phosphate dehydrogenase